MYFPLYQPYIPLSPGGERVRMRDEQIIFNNYLILSSILNKTGDSVMCKCGCASKPAETQAEETVKYYCMQCNEVKEAKEGAPKPECCGKKMSEVD